MTDIVWARTFVIAGLLFVSVGEVVYAPFLVPLGLTLWWLSYARRRSGIDVASTVVVTAMVCVLALAAGLYAIGGTLSGRG